MACPWAILDSIEKWVSVLRQHIDRLKISPEDRRDYEQSCKYTFVENNHVIFYIHTSTFLLLYLARISVFIVEFLSNHRWNEITLEIGKIN
jgi:hypothetical protein